MSGRRDRTTQLLIQEDTSSSLSSQYDPTSKFQSSSEFGMISGYPNIQGMLQKVPSHLRVCVSQPPEQHLWTSLSCFKQCPLALGHIFWKPSGNGTGCISVAVTKGHDWNLLMEKKNLFWPVVPGEESVMVGKHGSRWPEQEAGRPYSQPQAWSRTNKLEVEPGYELSKPIPSNICPPARLNH